MGTAAPHDETAVQKAFQSPVDFQTEAGRTFYVGKWSVRKFTTMGRAISKLIDSVFSLITDQRRADYARAVEEAKAKGLTPDDEGWPNAEAYEAIALQDILAAVPATIETAAHEVALIVSQSLTNRENGEVSIDEVLDDFTIADLLSALELIFELNFDKGALGKLTGLLNKITKGMG